MYHRARWRAHQNDPPRPARAQARALRGCLSAYDWVTCPGTSCARGRCRWAATWTCCGRSSRRTGCRSCHCRCGPSGWPRCCSAGPSSWTSCARCMARRAPSRMQGCLASLYIIFPGTSWAVARVLLEAGTVLCTQCSCCFVAPSGGLRPAGANVEGGWTGLGCWQYREMLSRDGCCHACFDCAQRGQVPDNMPGPLHEMLRRHGPDAARAGGRCPSSTAPRPGASWDSTSSTCAKPPRRAARTPRLQRACGLTGAHTARGPWKRWGGAVLDGASAAQAGAAACTPRSPARMRPTGAHTAPGA